MLDLVLLGQPILRVNREPVAVPTKKALALIAYLAIEGPAPRSRLADGLWPSIEPEKARGNLRRELNRLRHTPLGSELVSEGASIALSEPFSSDVREFSKKIDARDFSAALALYRGPFLDGLELYDADGFDDWLARRRASLAERQRAMLALEAKSRDENQDPRGALVCYLDLIRLDPTQESYHKEAMRLHYLVGEREAALERFAELKRVLRRELALEPLPETIELYRSIRSVKRLPDGGASGKKLASTAWPLVGRATELARLESTERPCFLVLADPGIGKTRLGEESLKKRPGKLVLRANEASISTPLYPVASALRSAWDDAEAHARLVELEAVWRREAARLVPEFDPDAVIGRLHAEARPRFLEGLARALARAVGPNGVVLLDDLHWFDAASVELTLHLCQRALSLGIRLIATARPLELATSPAQAILETLERDGLCERMELEPLRESDVLALLHVACPADASADFAQRLHRATAGNPLYLLETLKTVEDDASNELPVPSGVRDAVLTQVEKRGPKLRRLLEAASLTGMRFSLDDLDGATGLDAFEAVDALEEAIRAGFVVRDGDGTRFHHELVRRALADGLSEERRRLIHEKLALALSAREGTAARVAEHYVAAGKAEGAIAFRVRAAEDALELFAYEPALEQFQKLLALPIAPERAFEIHGRRIAIHRWRDDHGAWQSDVNALEVLSKQTADERLVAHTLSFQAELDNSLGRYAEALAHADRALDLAASDEAIACSAWLEGARALVNLGRVAAARERLARAAAIVPEHELGLIAEIERTLYVCALTENDLEGARTHNERARRADEARSDPYGLVTARIADGTIQRRAGDVGAAIEHLSGAIKDANGAGLVSLERSALLSLASAHNLLGEYARAAELAAHGIELARQPADPLLELRFENALAAFEYSLGKLASSIAHSDRAIAIALQIRAGSWSAFVRMGLGHTLLELGEPARALEVLAAARATITDLGLTGQEQVIETHLAHAELFLKGPETAVTRLERTLGSGAPASLDPDYTFSILGQAKLAAGDARGALEALRRHEFRPIHRSRALSVELEAKRALNEDLAAEIADAEVLLQDPRLTPVESLGLTRALIRAAGARGETARVESARLNAEHTLARLLDGLTDEPELRARFLARNSDFRPAQ